MTVTVNKIVVALGEECKAGTVTGSMTTTTTSKNPGNTMTTRTRMTVTIKDVMPQENKTMVERKRKYCARKAGPVDVSAKIASQQSKRAEKDHKNQRNWYHSTKTSHQAGPVDVSAKIASHQMKHAEINRTYQSREHVKERRANNQRNTHHSTKAAQQAADVDGIIEAPKKKRANKNQ